MPHATERLVINHMLTDERFPYNNVLLGSDAYHLVHTDKRYRNVFDFNPSTREREGIPGSNHLYKLGADH